MPRKATASERLQRAEDSDMELAHDVLIAMRVQLDLRMQFLDAPNSAAVHIAHHAPDEFVKSNLPDAHFLPPCDPGIRRTTFSHSHRSRCSDSSV